MRIENVLFGSVIAIFYDGDLPSDGKLPKKENCVLFKATRSSDFVFEDNNHKTARVIVSKDGYEDQKFDVKLPQDEPLVLRNERDFKY